MICQFYLEGNCRKGNNCEFDHINPKDSSNVNRPRFPRRYPSPPPQSSGFVLNSQQQHHLPPFSDPSPFPSSSPSFRGNERGRGRGRGRGNFRSLSYNPNYESNYPNSSFNVSSSSYYPHQTNLQDSFRKEESPGKKFNSNSNSHQTFSSSSRESVSNSPSIQQVIMHDMTRTRPQWPLSSYGINLSWNAGRNLLHGDISNEECRMEYYHQRLAYKSTVKYEEMWRGEVFERERRIKLIIENINEAAIEAQKANL